MQKNPFVLNIGQNEGQFHLIDTSQIKASILKRHPVQSVHTQVLKEEDGHVR